MIPVTYILLLLFFLCCCSCFYLVIFREVVHVKHFHYSYRTVSSHTDWTWISRLTEIAEASQSNLLLSHAVCVWQCSGKLPTGIMSTTVVVLYGPVTEVISFYQTLVSSPKITFFNLINQAPVFCLLNSIPIIVSCSPPMRWHNGWGALLNQPWRRHLQRESARERSRLSRDEKESISPQGLKHQDTKSSGGLNPKSSSVPPLVFQLSSLLTAHVPTHRLIS